MVGRVALVALVLVIAFVAAQFVRPARSNPTIIASHTLAAQIGGASPVTALLDRSCGDCHSNATDWSRYPRIAPISWAVAAGVAEGRKAMNMSDWAAYAPEQRRALLAQSCRDASEGKMPPGVFFMLRPQARLTPSDVRTLCAANPQP